MIVGSQLWPADVTAGMTSICVRGRTFSVFEDAPATLYTSLRATAARQPTSVALVDDDGSVLTFAQLLKDVDQLAARLGARANPGSRIAVLLETSVEFVTCLYAINRLGCVCVPIPIKHRGEEIIAVVSRAAPALLIAEERFAAITELEITVPAIWVRDEARRESLLRGAGPAIQHSHWATDSDADAMLIYTSGTTAASKGALLTNRNVCHAITAYQRTLGLDAADSTIIPVPIYYVTGLIALLGLFVHIGGRIHLQRRFSADRVLATVRDEGITFVHASPTVYSLLLECEPKYPDLPSLRRLACGAAHMPVSRIDALHRWLPQVEFRTVYGLTESSSPALVFPTDAGSSPHRGSSGVPIPGLELEIRAGDGTEVPVGRNGEVWLRGANILTRYDRLDTPTITADGWFYTGDIGCADDVGYVFIVDRTKDMINRGGEKVWCIDVEEHLRSIPGVLDAAVVGVPDEKYGEVPAALLVLEEGRTLESVAPREALGCRIAKYQVPEYYLVAGSLPLTGNLKVDKSSIRGMFASPRRGS